MLSGLAGCLLGEAPLAVLGGHFSLGGNSFRRVGFSSRRHTPACFGFLLFLCCSACASLSFGLLSLLFHSVSNTCSKMCWFQFPNCQVGVSRFKHDFLHTPTHARTDTRTEGHTHTTQTNPPLPLHPTPPHTTPHHLPASSTLRSLYGELATFGESWALTDLNPCQRILINCQNICLTQI